MDKEKSLQIPNLEDEQGVLPELIDKEVKGDRTADAEADHKPQKANEKHEIYTGF